MNIWGRKILLTYKNIRHFKLHKKYINIKYSLVYFKKINKSKKIPRAIGKQPLFY